MKLHGKEALPPWPDWVLVGISGRQPLAECWCKKVSFWLKLLQDMFILSTVTELHSTYLLCSSLQWRPNNTEGTGITEKEIGTMINQGVLPHQEGKRVQRHEESRSHLQLGEGFLLLRSFPNPLHFIVWGISWNLVNRPNVWSLDIYKSRWF